MFPLTHEIYAVAPTRLWWAPWRWALRIYWFRARSAASFFSYIEDEIVATNLSRAEVIGLIKLLGYHHEISN